MKHLKTINAENINVSMESIRFQDGAFFRDLTAVLDPYITGAVPDKSDREKLGLAITSVINKYTKLNIKCIWGGYYAINLPDWFKDHLFLERWKDYTTEQDGHKLIRAAKDKKISGSVNLQTATVTGFYSEQIFQLLISAPDFSNRKLKAEHHAAVILHECGHAFTMCEMIDRVVHTNQILSRLWRELTESDPAKRKTLIQKAGKDLGISDQTVESASNSANTEVTTTILLTGLLKESSHNTNSPYYNASVAEKLADEFATRMGAGHYLIEALDIYGVPGSSLQKRSAAEYYVLEFIKTTLSLITIPILPVWCITLIWIASDSTDSEGVYDTPHDRIKRVRNQIIEGMKNFNATKEVINDYHEQLQLVDSVLSQYTNRQQWWGNVFDYLFNYKGIKDRDFQQQLEALAANELFRRAQELKHLK